jgi:hypothetical protein
LSSKPPGRPVFRLTRTADMLKIDFAAAGIDYVTPSGVSDFHTLRGAYVSAVVASGASARRARRWPGMRPPV